MANARFVNVPLLLRFVKGEMRFSKGKKNRRRDVVQVKVARSRVSWFDAWHFPSKYVSGKRPPLWQRPTERICFHYLRPSETSRSPYPGGILTPQHFLWARFTLGGEGTQKGPRFYRVHATTLDPPPITLPTLGLLRRFLSPFQRPT